MPARCWIAQVLVAVPIAGLVVARAILGRRS